MAPCSRLPHPHPRARLCIAAVLTALALAGWAGAEVPLQSLKYLERDYYVYNDIGQVLRIEFSLTGQGFSCSELGVAVCLQKSTSKSLGVLKTGNEAPLALVSTITQAPGTANTTVFQYSATSYSDPLGAELDALLQLLDVLLSSAASSSALAAPLPGPVCLQLQALGVFASTFLRCGDADAATYADLYRESLVPVIEQTAQNLRVNLSTALTVECAPGLAEPEAAFLGTRVDADRSKSYALRLRHDCGCAAPQDPGLCATAYVERRTPLERFYSDHFGEPSVQCNRRVQQYFGVGGTISSVFTAAIWVLDLIQQHRWGCVCCSAPYSWLGWLDLLTPVESLYVSSRDPLRIAAALGCLSMVLANLVLEAFVAEIPTQLISSALFLHLPLFLTGTLRPVVGLVSAFAFSVFGFGYLTSITNCFARANNVYLVLAYTPSLVCFLVVAALCVRRVVVKHKCSLASLWRPSTRAQQNLHRLDRRFYLRHLLAHKVETPEPSIGWKRFGAKVPKTWNNPGFLFSPRLVAVAFVGTILTAICCAFWAEACEFVGLALENVLSGGRCCAGVKCYTSGPRMHWVGNPLLESAGFAGVSLDIGGKCETTFLPILQATRWALSAAGFIAASVNIAYLIKTVFRYRELLQQMLRGNFSRLPRRLPSTTMCIANSLKYAGSQLAYLIFGWLVGSICLTAFFLILAFTIVLPQFGVLSDTFWPWVYSAMIYNPETKHLQWFSISIINYVMVYVATRFVLQIDPKTLGIRRHFLFAFVDLLEFLLYTVNGILAFFTRLFYTLLYLLVFLSRLDKCMVPRGHEAHDPGYRVFLGFMLVEYYHNNPVLLTACYLLASSTSGKRLYVHPTNGDPAGASASLEPVQDDSPLILRAAKTTSGPAFYGHSGGGGLAGAGLGDEQLGDVVALQYTSKRPPNRRLRNRWQVLLTLHNNPGLAKHRRSEEVFVHVVADADADTNEWVGESLA